MIIRSTSYTAFSLFILSSVAIAGPGAAPQFHGGPAHLGAFDSPSPGNLRRFVWHFQAPNRILASPIVAGGALYVGDKSGDLFALDAKTGALRWRIQADSGISSTVAISDGIAFFQSDSNTIFATRVSDGNTVWKRPTGASHDWHNMPALPQAPDWDYWTSSPLVIGQTVVIGSGDGSIYAPDAATGAIRWQFVTADRVRATPASDGRTVYAGSFDGMMYALDAANGKLRWKFKTSGNTYFPHGEIQSSPVLAGGLVLFGSRDYNLYALDARTGKEVWRNLHKDSWVVSTPAVADGRVIVGSSDGRRVRAVDLKTGTEIWTRPAGENVFSSPIVVGDMVYVATAAGVLVGLDTKNGHPVAGLQFDDRVVSTPWIENGILYTASADGRIDAIASGPAQKKSE